MKPFEIFDKNEIIGLFSMIPYTGKDNEEQRLRQKLIRLSKGSKFEHPFDYKELKIMYDQAFIVYHDRDPPVPTLTKIIDIMEKMVKKSQQK